MGAVLGQTVYFHVTNISHQDEIRQSWCGVRGIGTVQERQQHCHSRGARLAVLE